jgi:uncharacterized protein
MLNLELIPFFFLIALIYASAGFGGGSSYLALLSLYGVAMNEMRVVALLCNLVVVSGNIWVFWRKDLIDLNKALPLILFSVPMAFLGAYIPIKEKTFFLLLGISLILAALVLLLDDNNFFRKEAEISAKTLSTPISPIKSSLLGGTIGFFSGMVGIGGGIFLSPILMFLRWDMPKRIAAVASLFIGVNSLAGLAGQWSKVQNLSNCEFYFCLLISVCIGGQIGSRMSVIKFEQRTVKFVTALLTLYAGVNLLMK